MLDLPFFRRRAAPLSDFLHHPRHLILHRATMKHTRVFLERKRKYGSDVFVIEAIFVLFVFCIRFRRGIVRSYGDVIINIKCDQIFVNLGMFVRHLNICRKYKFIISHDGGSFGKSVRLNVRIPAGMHISR